jgi:hypothetical protein
MTSSQAKEVLQAYRPDTDSADSAFADALEAARRDPELARWLEDELHHDTTAREALAAELPPPGLREALHAVRPRGRKFQPAVLALAAGLMVFLAVSFLFYRTVIAGPVTAGEFVERSVHLAATGRIVLGREGTDVAGSRAWLAGQGSPDAFPLPAGLKALPGLGCQTYLFGATRVSLMCFLLPDGKEVHLFVADNSSLRSAKPKAEPDLQTKAGVAWISWARDGRTFVLVGPAVDPVLLRRLAAPV